MPTFGSNGQLGARCQPVPLPMRYRVQFNLCSHPLLDVEENGCFRSPFQGAQTQFTAVSQSPVTTPLHGRLRQGEQGSLRRYISLGAHHHQFDSILRFDQPSRL